MRISCPLCACKHLGQARALLLEMKKGYEHFDYALGHLGEAEDELVADFPGLAAAVRQHRKQLENDPNYAFPFRDLVLTIRNQTGYSVAGVFKQGGFMKKALGWLKYFGVLIAINSFAGLGVSGGSVIVVGGGASSNEVVSIISTSTVPVALLAASLGVPGGDTTLSTESGGVLVFTVVTNSTSLYVVSTSSTNPATYSGPPAGATWVSPEYDDAVEIWFWQTNNGFLAQHGPAVPLLGEGWWALTSQGAGVGDFYYLATNDLPVVAEGRYGGVGRLTLDWVPLTNVFRFSSSGLTTNRIIVAGDTLHFTNGCLKAITEAP